MSLEPREKQELDKELVLLKRKVKDLEFAINALADEALIKNNFSGKPTTYIPSIDWALKREKQE